MVKGSNIATLALGLVMGLSFARCGDEYEYHGVARINGKTYEFSEEKNMVNRFSIVPFDSAWGHYFYDGNNDHRMTSLADYYMVFDPRTWAGEIVRYGDPRFAEADSEYVAEWTLFKDTLDERATKKIKANNANSP